MKYPNPQLPSSPDPLQFASCSHSFLLKHNTWTLMGWQRASSQQINRGTCGLWKWGFLCYCFKQMALMSPEIMLFITTHPLPPASHSEQSALAIQPDRQGFSLHPPPHTQSHTPSGSHPSPHPYRAEETDGGVTEVQSVLHVCLVHS